MANSLGIDFSPEPAAGSNPFEPLVQGLNLGFGIQQQLREQQKFEQDRLAVQAQAKNEQEKMKLLKFGQVSDLYSSVKDPILRKAMYMETVRPMAKQALGADMPEQYTDEFDKYLSAYGELNKKYVKGEIKYDEFKKLGSVIYNEALLDRENESAASIEKSMQFSKPESSQAPFIVSTDTNTGDKMLIDKQSGTILQTIKSAGKRLPAEQVEKNAGLNVLGEQLRTVGLYYKPQYVGPIDARVGKLAQKTGIGADENKSKFYSNLQSIKNQLIYLRSGKAINEEEYKRLRDELPDETNSATDFETRLDTFNEVYNSIVENRRIEFEKSGYNVGGNSTASGKSAGTTALAEISEMSDEELQRIIAGEK